MTDLVLTSILKFPNTCILKLHEQFKMLEIIDTNEEYSVLLLENVSAIVLQREN